MLNAWFLLSHEDTQRWFLKRRRLLVYMPCLLVVAATVVELALVGAVLLQDLAGKYPDPNFKLYTILALFGPSVPVVCQCFSFSLLAFKMRAFLKKKRKMEMFSSVKQTAEQIEELTSRGEGSFKILPVALDIASYSIQ